MVAGRRFDGFYGEKQRRIAVTRPNHNDARRLGGAPQIWYRNRRQGAGLRRGIKRRDSNALPVHEDVRLAG